MMKTLMAILVVLPLQENDNPEFQRWAAFKVGSWTKYKSELEVNGTKVAVPTVMTATLLELDEKRAVVEQAIVAEVQGAKPEKPSRKTYPAKTRRKETVEKEGDEELEISGKKLACHWIEVKSAAASSKTWTHPDVPGGVVRLDIQVGTADQPRITRLIATGWEKK